MENFINSFVQDVGTEASPLSFEEIKNAVTLLNSRGAQCIECGEADERPLAFLIAEGHEWQIHESCLEALEGK